MKSSLARCADPKEHAHYCDVLVVGSGIAGLSAALEAADAGARVTVASRGPLCSGSSFFPGTWGLGMIGPVDESDEKSLEQAIEDVGCNMAEPTLVRTLVHGIQPALARLESLGCALKHPARSGEREYIPCFDRKDRLWRGILREPSERALKRALGAAHVRVLEQCELLDLADAGQGSRLSEGLFPRMRGGGPCLRWLRRAVRTPFDGRRCRRVCPRHSPCARCTTREHGVHAGHAWTCQPLQRHRLQREGVSLHGVRAFRRRTFADKQA